MKKNPIKMYIVWKSELKTWTTADGYERCATNKKAHTKQLRNIFTTKMSAIFRFFFSLPEQKTTKKKGWNPKVLLSPKTAKTRDWNKKRAREEKAFYVKVHLNCCYLYFWHWKIVTHNFSIIFHSLFYLYMMNFLKKKVPCTTQLHYPYVAHAEENV